MIWLWYVMKLLFENWRKFIMNEGISPAIKEFERCYKELEQLALKRGPVPRMSDGTTNTSWSDLDRDVRAELSREGRAFRRDKFDTVYVGCTKTDDSALQERCLKNFKKLGVGAFRSVFAVPDNPDVVLKVIITDEHGEGISYMEPFFYGVAVQSNIEEAQLGREAKFIEFSPKSYEVSEKHHWIVVQRVTPLAGKSDKIMIDFFPGFENSVRWGGGFDWVSWKKTLEYYSNYLKYGEWLQDHEVRQRSRSPETTPHALASEKPVYTPLKGKYPVPPWLQSRPEGSKGYRGEEMEERFLEMSKAVENPDHPIHRLINFVLEKDLSSWDFKPANVGFVVEENGEKRFVVLDPVARMDV